MAATTVSPAQVLATLRSLTLSPANQTQPCPLPLLIDRAPTDDIAQATHALLPPTNTLIDLDLPLPLWSSKAGLGHVTLRSLLVLWAMRSSAFGEYMMNTSMRGGPKAASVTAPERQETLAWLRGEKDGCKLIEQWVAHMGAQAPSSFAAAGGVGGAAGGMMGGDDAMDVDQPSAPDAGTASGRGASSTSAGARQALDNHAAPASASATAKVLRSADIEYTQRSRLTYLTAPNAKDFSYLVKITHDPLVRGKPAPRPSSSSSHANGSSSSSKASSHHRSSSSRPSAGGATSTSSTATSAKSVPIILVPPGLNSLLTMYNVKSLLEDAKYTPTDQARQSVDKKPTLLEIQRKAADPGAASSASSSSSSAAPPTGSSATGGTPWNVLVMDSPDRLQTPADWDRVIAVFAGGMAWQFDGWRWSNPVDLFGKVRGYHLRMHDEQVPPSVQGWNVKHLVLHRTKRHLDLPAVLEFWTDLERWVRGHKPHLLL